MNLKFGYYAALEQYAPDKLLKYAVLADKYGFDTVTASDHFHPYLHTEGQSAFAFAWLAATAGRTGRVTLGSVTPPVLRYHPAIVAQAAATLEWLYPGRIYISVCTGEAMNEVPLGYKWPSPHERVERLEEAIRIIKLLFNESFVTFKGKYYRLKKANLYTKSENKIPIYIATGGIKVARMAGELTDGIITTSGSIRKLGADAILSSFNEGAKSANKDPESMAKGILQIASYDEDFQRAVKSARYWAAPLLRFVFKYEISDPREIESYANLVSDEQLISVRLITTTHEDFIKSIEEYEKMGFNWILFINTSPEPEKFIKMFGEKVIPYFKER